MKRSRYLSRYIAICCAAVFGALAGVVYSNAQSVSGQKGAVQPPPPPPTPYLDGTAIPDSVMLMSPVQTTVPQGYSDYAGREFVADLRDPQNITTEAEYDPATGMYWIRTKLGDREIVTPYMMTAVSYTHLRAHET